MTLGQGVAIVEYLGVTITVNDRRTMSYIRDRDTPQTGLPGIAF